MHRIVSAWGHPHATHPSVHIAGTNGKGSTACILAYMLAAQGYRVGLYTSPHLVRLNERIRILNPRTCLCRIITDRQLALLTIKLRRICETADPDIPVTFFEATTALAMAHFARQKVDIAIYEAGLGGRLDATNILRPLVSIITNVDKDHQQWLGQTIAKIAGEKAAIVKTQTPVVTAERKQSALRVIKQICQERKAPLYIQNTQNTQNIQKQSCAELSLPLQGAHQSQNLACAMTTMCLLKRKGFRLDRKALKHGLGKVRWPGRWETISDNPRILCDAAHNPSAFRALKKSLQHDYRGWTIHLILAILDDKDRKDMCRILLPCVETVTIPSLQSRRFQDKKGLQTIVRTYGKKAAMCRNVRLALTHAQTKIKDHRKELILVTGSVFLVGALMRNNLCPRV